MANNCHLLFCHDRRNHFVLYSWDAVFVQKGMHCKTFNIFNTILKTFPICRWQTIAISCFAMIEEITLDYFHGMLCLSKKGMHCKTCNIIDTKLKTFPICKWQKIAISCFAMIEEIILDYFHGMLCLSKKVCIV